MSMYNMYIGSQYSILLVTVKELLEFNTENMLSKFTP